MTADLSNSSEAYKIIHTLSNILSNDYFSQQNHNQLLVEFKSLLSKAKSSNGNALVNNDKILSYFTNVLALFEKSKQVTFNQIKASINQIKTLDTSFVTYINALSGNIKAYTLKAKNSFLQMSNNVSESIDEILAMKILFNSIAETYESTQSKGSYSCKITKYKLKLFKDHHDFLIDQAHQLTTIIQLSDSLAINFFNEAKNTFKLIKVIHKGQPQNDNINSINNNTNEALLINFSKGSKSAPRKKKQKSRATPFINPLPSNMMVENSVFINNSCYTNITNDISSINNTCPNNFNNPSTYNDNNINTFKSTSLNHSNQNSQLFLRSHTNIKSFHLSNHKKSSSSNKQQSRASSISINYPSDISIKELSELILEFINKIKQLQEAICRKDKNVSLFKKNFEVQKRAIIKLASILVRNPLNNESKSQIKKLEEDIKVYKEEINTLKEQKSQFRNINNLIRELNSENDSLKQANEGLVAHSNEMRAHIKKSDLENDSLMKYKNEYIKLSLKIQKISKKKKDSIANNNSITNNQLTNLDYDNDIDVSLIKVYSIDELIKENGTNLNQIMTIINMNANNANIIDTNSNHGSKNENRKMKSTLADILMTLNDLIRSYSQDEEIESTFNIIAGNSNPINLLDSSHRSMSKKSNQSLSIPIIDQEFIISQIEKLKKILQDHCSKIKSLTSELNKKNSLSKSQFIYNDELSNCFGRTFTVEDLLNPQTDPKEGIEDDIIKIKNELIAQLIKKDKEIQKLNEQITQVTNHDCNEDDQSANIMRLLSEEKEKNNKLKKTYLKTVSDLMNKIEKVYKNRINEDKLKEILKLMINDSNSNPKTIEYAELIKKICFDNCVDNKKEEDNGKKREKNISLINAK